MLSYTLQIYCAILLKATVFSTSCTKGVVGEGAVVQKMEMATHSTNLVEPQKI